MLTKSNKALITLLLLVLFMTSLLMYSGPRLRGYELDMRASLVSPERLVLNVNQQIKPLAGPNVTLSPSQGYKVTSSADKIFIDFEEPLLSGQRYELKVSGVESSRSSKKASKKINFTTPHYDYSYIERAASVQDVTKSNDKVFLATLGDEESRLLYEAPMIDELTSVGSKLAVSEVSDDNSHKVYLVDKKGNREAIELGNSQQITMMRGAKDGTLLGFLRTDLGASISDRRTKLSFYDVQAKVVFDAINGDIGGDGISDWFLSPDSSIVAVITQRNSLFVSAIDGVEEPVYYGRYDSIAGFSHDGGILFITDKNETVELDLSTGKTSPLADIGISERVSSNQVKPKNGSTGFVVQTFIFGEDPDNYENSLLVTAPTQKVREIIRLRLVDQSIINVDSSPNDQFVFVETSEPKTARYDNYPSVRKPTNVNAKIIDSVSGEIKTTIRGFDITIW